MKEAAHLRKTQLRQRADKAEQAAEREQQRAERRAEVLGQLGRDPDKV